MNHTDNVKAMIIPIKGARKINPAVFNTGSELTAPNPPCAIAAPAKPPIKVWEDEEGMPNHQVSRFQQIAAIIPAKITGKVMKSTFTVLEIVVATLKSVNI